MKNKKIIVSLVAVLGIISFSFVRAQQPSSADQSPSPPPPLFGSSSDTPVVIAGTVDCFDYYHFGSVQTDIESNISSTIPGVPMTFQGTVQNNNDYPVVDGAVYVKVFRKQTDQDKAHANGFFLVDQFFAKGNIDLGAKSTQDINFNWTVPNYAQPGEYQIATFFTSAKEFNLSGLSFTDDVVGNTFDFAVKGEDTAGVEFNKNTADINGDNYHFAAFPPQFKKDEDIVVKADLANSTKTAQTIPVTWTLYSWDGQQDQNILDTKKDTITLGPNETKNLSYTIKDQNHPVYYLVAEADYQDAKSILDIRTVRQGIDQTRINFPGVTSYPLKQGEKDTLFVCAHNSGTADVVDNNKLVVSILDANRQEIHTYTYNGQISGDMMGLKDDFVPQQDYDSFYIKSDLYTNDKLVDSAEMKYDCQTLNAGKCPNENATSSSPSNLIRNMSTSKIFDIALAIIIILLVISLVSIVIKRKNASGIRMLILWIILPSILFLGGIKTSEAKSTVWNQSYSTNLYYFLNRFGTSAWKRGLANPNFQISYQANVINQATGAKLTDGNSIPVGTTLLFQPKPFADTDISWFGTGYSSDSPYGHWNSNAASPKKATCDSNDFVDKTYYPITASFFGHSCSYSLRFDVYIPFMVNSPSISVSHAGSTAGLSCNADGSICTVTSPGTIQASFDFSSTYGKLYYRYYDYSDGHYCWLGMITYSGDNGCYGNATPMSSNSSGGSAFQVNVPQEMINYNLTATGSGNNPPAPPSIIKSTGETTGKFVTGLPNTPYTFNLTSTDPDGDQIRYGVDWNMDGVVDQYIPAINYVNSGTMQQANNPGTLWIMTGSKTFQAETCDNKGACSAWTSYALTLAAAPTCSCDASQAGNYCSYSRYNDSCGKPVCNGTKTCTTCFCDASQAGNYCSYSRYNDSCGKSVCNGTQNCAWKEVAPK